MISILAATVLQEVLKIFLKRQGGGDKDKDKQNGAGDDLEGSGSGDEPGKKLLSKIVNIF